jgi:steroid delta-isomerase-like uncharacterized protein
MDNKTLMRRFYQEVVNERRLDAMDDFVAEDVIDHEVPPELPAGRDGVKAFFGAFIEAVPDLHAEVHELFGEGDYVAGRATWTGTQEGDLPGIPATGKRFSVDGIDIVRFVDGQAVEHWGVTDDLGMLTQLGVIPEPAAAS